MMRNLYEMSIQLSVIPYKTIKSIILNINKNYIYKNIYKYISVILSRYGHEC